jgi:hypothetical protein
MNENEGVAQEVECDGCDFHRAGLELVAALFAHLGELERRLEALEGVILERRRRAA